MLIADAQVHIWGPDTPERPWRAGQRVHREGAFGAAELLQEMDAAGVARAVIVPPYWEAERHDVVLAAARSHPDRFAAMGRLDTEAPHQNRGFVDWCRQSGVAAICVSFNRPEQAAQLVAGNVEWLWREAEKAGMPVMALVTPALLPQIGRVAGEHPALKLTLRHLALASERYDDDAFRDFERLLALARRPNVSVNASALPLYTKDNYPYRRLHPYLQRLHDAFGPRRIFWGSDLSRLARPYREAVTMFTEEMPWLGDEDKVWIMGRALCEWLGWKLP